MIYPQQHWSNNIYIEYDLNGKLFLTVQWQIFEYKMRRHNVEGEGPSVCAKNKEKTPRNKYSQCQKIY